MGPPGSGKGTQASRLAQRYGVPAISTGEIFRDHMQRGTELGLAVQDLIAAGEYVPDEITERIVGERLADSPDGFLLDGFPRTTPQLRFLDRFLSERGLALDAVLSLDVGIDELIARLAQRADEENRDDDTEEAIRRRMDVYSEETEELQHEYRDRGVLQVVDGHGSVEEVHDLLVAAVASRIGE